MSAPTGLLEAIAEHLGTTPEAMRDPDYLAGLRRQRATSLAEALAADPQFSCVARAYLELQDPAGRRAIADSVVAIAGAFTLRGAIRGDG